PHLLTCFHLRRSPHREPAVELRVTRMDCEGTSGDPVHSDDAPRDANHHYFTSSIDTISASVQVISTLSPTLNFASAAVSLTFDSYCHPWAPVNVMDGAFGSIAAIVAVIVR